MYIIHSSSTDIPQWFIVQEVKVYFEFFQGCIDACVLTAKNPVGINNWYSKIRCALCQRRLRWFYSIDNLKMSGTYITYKEDLITL